MTYPETRCFWLEFAGVAEIGLRRYTNGGHSENGHYDCAQGFHNAGPVIIGQHPAVISEEDDDGDRVMALDCRESRPQYPPHDDPRWPTHCEEGCGYAFTPDDAWQEWSQMLYRRSGTDELTTLRDAPPGAMWDAPWYPWEGPDGRCIVAKCPNGQDWIIDGRATNCTMKDDNEHRCWVRHGEPPNLTVDKNGFTCATGAGSIQTGDYHGFLRNGVFTEG